MLPEPIICLEYTSIPDHPLANSDYYPLSRIGGPDHSMPETFYAANGEEIFSAKSISTYPYAKGGREKDPISDRFYCSFYDKQTLFALADGGGNGLPSVDAAERAIIGLVEHMTV